MLNKLAMRNAKRSIRDYLVYLVTMIILASLMFSFNSMIFSKEILQMFSEAGIMGAMTGLATVFIVLIIAWLINYMVRFMLEKRSREFGTYLILGMEKRQIAALYMRENMILGIVSFVAGIFGGIFLQQILMTVFYRIFSMNYHLKIEVNGWCFLMTVICFFLCFGIALLRNHKLFRKMNIVDFMHMDKENERIKEKKNPIKRLLFIAAIIYIIYFEVMLVKGNYSVSGVILMTIGIILAIYALFYGFSSFIELYVKKCGKRLYKNNRLFLLRQYLSKLRTMRFTMGTLTVLFSFTLLGGSIAILFVDYQQDMLGKAMPFDILAYSKNPLDDFQKEEKLIHRECQVKQMFSYKIYQNGNQEMNEYMYTHCNIIGNKYCNEDGSINRKQVKKDGCEYYDFDTYLKLSDYNKLRQMLGYSKITLKETEYAIQIKKRLYGDLNKTIKNRVIKGKSGDLSLSKVYTLDFSQNGNNGADYLIIIPDNAAMDMKPYYSNLVVKLTKKAPKNLQDKLENISIQKYGLLTEKEFEKKQEEGKIPEEEIWDNVTLGGYGTDQIICLNSDILVRDNLQPQMQFILTSVVFPMVYMGLVFLCVALTVMAVQQLSDAGKYRYRYDVLFKLGMNRNEINHVIFIQLLFYYAIPALLSIGISAGIAIFAGNQFARYTGTSGNGFTYFGNVLLMFLSVYIIYFAVTYIGFKRNIEKMDRY